MRTLRVNYRTSHEIRRYADRLLPPELSDVDGNPESRRGTVSVFSGAIPAIEMVPSVEAEGLADRLVERADCAGLGAW